MSKRQAEIVLHYMHRLVSGSATGSEPDRQLLERFALRHEEAAFAALLARHGAMVLRVCRRILHDAHEAEDAFQATFLILARKAATVRQQQSLSSWLYKVAYRVAVHTRTAAVRREHLATRAPRRVAVDPLAEVSGRELLSVLDDELQRLPEKYRAPLVLCYLEGRTQDEAARQLGWRPATLRGRIDRGRTVLRRRLIRRGFGLSAALAGSLFEGLAAPAAPPAALAVQTLRSVMRSPLDLAGNVSPHVAALVASGVNALDGVKRKLALSLILMLGIATAGAGFLGLSCLAEKTPPSQIEEAKQPAPKNEGDVHGDPLPPGSLSRLGTIRFRQGNSVNGLTFSPDGKTLASCNFWGQDAPAIYLWDVSSGKLLRQFLGHNRSIFYLAFAPDGKTLASTSRDKTIRLWDIATGKEVRRIDTPDGEHHFLVFSPDGRRLATTCSTPKGQPIALWDIATGKERLRLQGDEKVALTLSFAPDGKSLASSSQGPNLTLWDLASGKEIRRIEIGTVPVPVYRRPVAFTPDGKRLVAVHADNTLRLWDIATGVEVRAFRGHKKAAARLAFSADGKTLTSVADDRTVRFWDVADGKERRAVTIDASGFMFDSVALSPGEKLLAVAGTNNAIRLFDMASGKELRAVGHQAPVSALAFSPDGQAVTSISWDKTFRRWDATTGQELRRSGGLKATVLSCPIKAKAKDNYIATYLIHAVCLSSDGLLLATGENSTDARIHLWDVAGGKEIRSFASNTGTVITLAFSPDNRVLASGSWDKSVRLWDVATGKELRRFSGHEGGALGTEGIHSVCFSADGRWLASSGGDRTVRVWEVATGKELHRLRSETSVYTTAFSPDGRMLATAGSQYANEQPGFTGIVLWEIGSGKERRRLAEREWVVGPLAFSPDGRFLASGSADGTVRIWEPLTGTERGRFAGHQGLVKSLAFSNDGKRLVSGGSDTTALVWDMGWLPPATARQEQSQKEIGEDVWQDLAGADAARAYQAMARLVVSSDSVRLLKKRLRPLAPVDGEKLTQWIHDLDSDAFATREQASAELAKLGNRAEPALRQALGKPPSLEARRRIEALLDKLSPLAPHLLFSLRAVEVLEHIASPEARAILQDLANEDPDARLTREAKEALHRLDLRSSDEKKSGR